MKNIENIVPIFGKIDDVLQYAWLAWFLVGIVLVFISLKKITNDEIIVKMSDQRKIPVKVTSSPFVDDNGKTLGKLSVAIISKECHWEYRSKTNIVLNDKAVDMTDFLRSDGMKAHFKNSDGIIAVGCASEEGDRKNETRRAQDRANKLIHDLRQEIISTDIKLYALNIGQHKVDSSSNSDDTAEYRRVIFISLKSKWLTYNKENTLQKLEAALRRDLDKNSSWPYKINDYSSFVLIPAK